MPRLNKTGLDYFPLDVSVDEKLELIEAKFGLVGFAVIIKLYQRIYRNGYFLMLTEERLLLFGKRVNVNINEISDIINDACRWDIFNKAIYRKFAVLTSHGIQKRFVEASKRRKEVDFIREYLLIKDVEKRYPAAVNVNINEINTYKTLTEAPVNVNRMLTITSKNADIGTQRKGKESKVYKNLPQNAAAFAVEVEPQINRKEPQAANQPHFPGNGNFYVGKIGKKEVVLKGELLDAFNRFWLAFNLQKGKAEAAGAWYLLNPNEDLIPTIIEAATIEAEERVSLVARGKSPKWAQGWLNGKRWEDEQSVIPNCPDPRSSVPPKEQPNYW